MDRVLVVGGGAKAAALAMKSKVLRELGLGGPSILIVEKNQIGANWSGEFGLTNGRQPLGSSALKDIGYPYDSAFGSEVDQRLFLFSWPSYLARQGWYQNWVDKGALPPTHGELSAYFRWVVAQSGVEVLYAEAQKFEKEGDHWRVLCQSRDTKEWDSIQADAIVFTGPGYQRISFPIFEESQGPKILFDSIDYWKNTRLFSGLQDKRIAVIGGGETAASVIVSLLDTVDVYSTQIDLISGRPTPFTRNEHYFENRYFSGPADWQAMSQDYREEFIRHTRAGNVSKWAKDNIDGAYLESWIRQDPVHHLFSKVAAVRQRADSLHISLEHSGDKHEICYDFAIVCAGFDRLWFKDSMTPPFLLTPEDVRANIGYDLSLNGFEPKLFLPMLSDLNQGIGFSELTCLGAFSDRILSTYVSARRPLAKNSTQKGHQHIKLLV